MVVARSHPLTCAVGCHGGVVEATRVLEVEFVAKLSTPMAVPRRQDRHRQGVLTGLHEGHGRQTLRCLRSPQELSRVMLVRQCGPCLQVWATHRARVREGQADGVRRHRPHLSHAIDRSHSAKIPADARVQILGVDLNTLHLDLAVLHMPHLQPLGALRACCAVGPDPYPVGHDIHAAVVQWGIPLDGQHRPAATGKPRLSANARCARQGVDLDLSGFPCAGLAEASHAKSVPRI
mmetsp:Transcript_121181/g.314676  ORF Transcript_121181/g.314676 Transcript_121181/m.314676 type:complete len:235 (+) Transcript_121181:261-965(+)